MFRPDTKRGITTMANQQSCWDFTMREFIAVAMRPDGAPVTLDCPIAVSCSASLPQPTRFGDFNQIPKLRIPRFPEMVVAHEVVRLAFDYIALAARYCCYASRLTAATFAEFRGIEVEGKLYNIHASAPYRVFAMPRLLITARGFAMSNYTIKGGV